MTPMWVLPYAIDRNRSGRVPHKQSSSLVTVDEPQAVSSLPLRMPYLFILLAIQGMKMVASASAPKAKRLVVHRVPHEHSYHNHHWAAYKMLCAHLESASENTYRESCFDKILNGCKTTM